MVEFPRDNRFPEPGVDARFTEPGVDWRFKDAPEDDRFPSPGIDRRWMGDPWNAPEGVAPSVIAGPRWLADYVQAGALFTADIGAAAGTPEPTSTVLVTFNGTPLDPISPGVWQSPNSGYMRLQVTWSNGIAPDLVLDVSQEVW